MKYRPRRASARWSEAAPAYVLACYDSGPNRGADRYTVMFGGDLWDESMGRNVAYLAMNAVPTHPAYGVSQCGEMPACNRDACGRHVRWLDLPADIRAHVIARAESD